MSYSEGAYRVREGLATLQEDAPPERPELGHARVRDLLSESLEGTLDADAQAEVLDHLDRCRPCRTFFRTLEATIDLAGRLARPRLPDQEKRRIVDRLVTATERGGVGGA